MSAFPDAVQVKRSAPGEESFRLLVETVLEYAIFMLDPDGHVVTWNEGARRIKGYAPNEIIGRHFSDFYTPEAKESGCVLAQPEMERLRFPLDEDSAPSGRGFSRHKGLSPDAKFCL